MIKDYWEKSVSATITTSLISAQQIMDLVDRIFVDVQNVEIDATFIANIGYGY